MSGGKRLAPLALGLVLLLSACGGEGRASGGAIRPGTGDLDRTLDAQLGLLTEYVTGEERAACLEILTTLQPIREARLDQGKFEKNDYEQRLLRRLNALYEAYTVQYLNPEAEDFGYENPPARIVAEYKIQPDGSLTTGRDGVDLSGWDWTEADLLALWEDMLDLLPEGAFADFTRLTLFSDGVDETVAYVYALDAKGTRWEIALDPADSDDVGYFTETVLHEYAHYLTLNADQVSYTGKQTVDTYNEPGMVSRAGSYLDDFYQAFWTDYLDDCLSCPTDTFNFFLRHYDDFIGPYASTDPSEDICESFTFFVLRPRDPQADEEVWSQKLDFFYDYPELVEFRQTVRDNLGLAEDEYFEDRYEDLSEASEAA